MKLRPVLIAGAFVALAVPALVAASSSAKAPKDYASIALNILPPGEAADSSANSTDQLALYDALTPLWNAVSPSNVHRLFKPETFGLQGKAQRVEDTGRKGLKIVRDKWDVAHITGKTRADVMFGSGYVTAEDRNLLMQLVRGPSRIAALDVPGLDAFSLALSGRVFIPSQQAEDFLAAQYQVLESRGAKGRAIIADIDAFVAGVNAYIQKTGLQIPPWNRNDFVASAALIGGIFGVAGGDEVRRAEFLDALQHKLGAAEGRQVWDRLRQVKDPDSPVTVPGHVFLRRGVRLGHARKRGGRRRELQAVRARRPEAGEAPVDEHEQRAPRRREEVGQQASDLRRRPPGRLLLARVLASSSTCTAAGSTRAGRPSPGIGYVVVGRGKDYAWSAMSSHSDIVDSFVETLCGGDDLHYRTRASAARWGRSTRACSRAAATSPTSS